MMLATFLKINFSSTVEAKFAFTQVRQDNKIKVEKERCPFILAQNNCCQASDIIESNHEFLVIIT